jgi:hypothetical protein
MKRVLFISMLLAGLLGCWTNMAAAQQTKTFELSASREPAGDETVEVQITTGPLPAGVKIVAMTEQGKVLGAIVPFALPGDKKGSTATIAVPPTAFVDRHLRLQLQVVQQGQPPRAPTEDEVRRVNLVIPPR